MRDFGEVTDSPSPVMTFQIAGTWLAVPVTQMDRVALAEHLLPVPLSRPEHAGLMDADGDLVPVLRLGPDAPTGALVAVLVVRGESVGVYVERTGRVHNGYRTLARARPPDWLQSANPRLAQGTDADFWLIDPDLLWPEPEKPPPLHLTD